MVINHTISSQHGFKINHDELKLNFMADVDLASEGK